MAGVIPACMGVVGALTVLSSIFGMDTCNADPLKKSVYPFHRKPLNGYACSHFKEVAWV